MSKPGTLAKHKAASQGTRRDYDAVFASILDNVSDGMLLVREDGTIDLANAVAESQFGATAGALKDRTVESLMGQKACALAAGILPPGDIPELVGSRLDGRTFPAECSFANLEIAGERRRLWIIRDNAARGQARPATIESKRRFDDFAEVSSDCFWETDAALTRVDIGGPPENEWASQLTEALISDTPDRQSPLRAYLNARRLFRTQIDIRGQTDRLYHIAIGGKPLLDETGNFAGFRGTARDLTSEVAELQASYSAQLRLIEAMDAAPSAIALVDSGLKVAGGNSALRELVSRVCATDLALEDIPFGEFLAKAGVAERGAAEEFLKTFAASGGVREIAVGQSWYLVAAKPLSDGGTMLSFSDVSMLKIREGELADAKRIAESANRVKSQFLATMSHELRTPLNAILGFAEIIRDGAFGQDEKAWQQYGEYANLIHSSGKHLLSVISSVLDLSKIEAGSYVLDMMPLDLGNVAEDALAMIKPVAAKAGVNVLWQVPEARVLIRADERAIRQVMLNLLSNAVKFTRAGGSIDVAVQTFEDAVEFSVTDTGIGIPEEYLDTVFEQFRQVDSSFTRRHEGTGLGLAITKRLVDLHGGKIAIVSAEGKGTSVRVRLPIERPADAKPGPPAQAA